MAMMYRIIANELEKAGLAHKYHPQDYLNFYCLGKRENSPHNSSEMNQQTENRSLVWHIFEELYKNLLFVLMYNQC